MQSDAFHPVTVKCNKHNEVAAVVVRVKRLTETAKMPEYAHPGDAGMDLFSDMKATIWPGGLPVAVKTGVSVEIPEGYVGLIWDKSGLALSGLSTLAGVVDSGYRGEVQVVMRYEGEWNKEIQAGQKIAQMIIQPVPKVILEEISELSETSRGSGGFGSTGLFSDNKDK